MSEVANEQVTISAQSLYEYYSNRVKDTESKKRSLEKELRNVGNDLTEARTERDRYKRQMEREKENNSKDQ